MLQETNLAQLERHRDMSRIQHAEELWRNWIEKYWLDNTECYITILYAKLSSSVQKRRSTMKSISMILRTDNWACSKKIRFSYSYGNADKTSRMKDNHFFVDSIRRIEKKLNRKSSNEIHRQHHCPPKMTYLFFVQNLLPILTVGEIQQLIIEKKILTHFDVFHSAYSPFSFTKSVEMYIRIIQ